MTKVIRHELSLPVTVRKYVVDVNSLRKLLRSSKRYKGITNRQISETLDRPITEVEHWFRTDACFSIPDADIWFELKSLLNIETDEFDAPITEFIEKPGVFEKANRFYEVDGIAPTLTVASSDEKIIVEEEYDSANIAMCLNAQPVGNAGGNSYLYLVDENYSKGSYNLTKINEELFEAKPFKYVSLFSGIGGFEQALNKLGGTCVLASEIDKFANQAYEVLYGKPTAGDITKIDAKDVPGHDLLVGGFPCQSYSVAGKRKGLDDARGTLFFEIVRIADEKKPKVLLLENVKGLVGHMSEADFDGAARFHLEKGEILWESDESSQNIRSSIVKRNVENYLRMRSLEILDCQQDRFTTLLESTQISDTEKAETFLRNGLTKRLKFLKTQILQTMKRLNDSQIEQIQRFVCNVDGLGSNLKKLNLEESSIIEDISLLELTGDTKKGVGSLWRNITEENSHLPRSFITSTETSRTIELTTYIFALTELLTIEYITKHFSLSVNLLTKALSDLTKKKKNTFTIPTLDILISTLNDIGYTVDFEVLNSKYFGVPQNRERIFIVAVRDDLVEAEPWFIEGNTVVPKGKRRISAYEGIKTFNFDWPAQEEVTTRLRDILETEVDEKYYLDDEKTAKLVAQLEAKKPDERMSRQAIETFNESEQPKAHGDIIQAYNRQHLKDGICPTLTTRPEGFKTASLPIVEGIAIKEATKKGYAVACEGDAVNFQFPDSKTRRGRVGKQIANTLEASNINQGVVEQPEQTLPKYRIRKLTPKECFRLQAFPDEAHDSLESAGISNSQRYKMAGNAVTVSVIEAIGERLIRFL